MIPALMTIVIDKVFGNSGFFYQTLKQEIPLQSGNVTQRDDFTIQISLVDSTSLLAQESTSPDVIVPIPTRPTKVKAYTKKIDTGTVRVSSHTRKPLKPTLKQRFKILKSAISKDTTPLRRPEINVHDVVRQSLIQSFQRLSK